MKQESKYLLERRALKLGAKPTAKETREKAKVKGAFFANAVASAPKSCENCGASLGGTKAINPAAIVAHILPKSKFPSVAIHPMNKIYLCGGCHDTFDNGSTKDIQKMNVFSTAVERLETFVKEVTETRALPKCFNTFVKKV